MTLSPTDILRELRRKLHSGHMSSLIGAGFSKNVDSDLFPSWSQLIYDMAYFLEGKAIENKYSLLPKSLQSDKKEYISSEINDFIEKTGYLELVSLFQKRKGFQESVAHYIEERTPYVRTDEDGKRFLFRRIDKGQNDIELTDEKLDLHRLLLNLSWNNIYTTNYDRLLEVANDDTSRLTLDSLLIEVEKNLNQLYGDLNKQRTLLTTNELQLSIHKNSSNNPFTAKQDDLYLSNIFYPANINDKNGLALQKSNNELKQEIFFLENQIKINEIEKIAIQKEIDNCLMTVVKSSQLGIKRNKNIIKLHGDLRNTEDSFGFDNDIRNHYVISKEHYDSYPKQHEAFTQLMRISLLQESYCLIGFSGEDPNFLGWITWVRDVIEKGNDNSSDIKVFLVDVGSPKDEADRALLFENHKIIKIYLDDKKSITFLEKETGLKLDAVIDRRKALLQLFLKYLSIDDFDTPNIFLEQHYKKQFLDAWVKIAINYDSKKLPDDFEKNLDLIIENRKYFTLIELNFSGIRYIKSFSHKFFTYLNLVKKKPIVRNKLVQISFIAFDILQLFPQQIWHDEQLNIFEKLLSTSDQDQYQVRKQKYQILNGEKYDKVESIENNIELEDQMILNRILSFLFHYDFENAKNEIEKWNPNSGLFILRKSGLLSYFSTNDGLNYLDAKKGIIEKSSLELLAYYFQYSIYLDSRKFNESIKKKRELYNKLEKKGFIGIYSHFKELSEQFKEKQGKIIPYGEGRFNLNNSIDFSNDISDSGKSFQFLHLCIHFALPLQISGYNLQSPETWYTIFKSNFENYPSAYLFYSLNYTDEKIIRRIGQDYAYSVETLPFVKANMLSLLEVYLNNSTPIRFKKSILLLTSEWFIAVDPKEWESCFSKIINEPEFFEKALDERRQEAFLFLKMALPLLMDIKIITSVIEKCLELFNDKNASIELLYHLVKDKVGFGKKIKANSKIKTLITGKIKLLSDQPTLWFILGNLKELLSKKDLLEIEALFPAIDFDNINNTRIWKIIYYFIKDDRKLMDIYKKELLNSNTIFKTGFNLDKDSKIKSLNGGEHYTSIRHLSINNSIWNEQELDVLFKRLCDELDLIKEWNKKERHTKFDFIYEEMIDFLDFEKARLGKLKDFNSIYDLVFDELRKERGYNTIKEALLSKDKNIVLKSLGELSLKLYDKKFEAEDRTNLSLLLNRLLFEDNFFTEVVLNYLAVWLKEKNIVGYFEGLEDIILLILEKFQNGIPKDSNKPFVLSQLINIADFYEKEYGENDVTAFYKNLKSKKEYLYQI